MGMHAVIPVLFVVAVEAARHAIGRIADITADKHMESIRPARWLLSPVPTFLLWRRMKLWELRSYQQVIKLEQERLVYQARLHARYGRAWRRKAPIESLMPLRLARHGVPLTETAPAGLAPGIDSASLPPAPEPPELAAARTREPTSADHPAPSRIGTQQPEAPPQDRKRLQPPPAARKHPRPSAHTPQPATVDRYYAGWHHFTQQHGREPDTTELSTHLAHHRVLTRQGQPIKAKTLARYLLGFRIYTVWAQHRSTTPNPHLGHVAAELAQSASPANTTNHHRNRPQTTPRHLRTPLAGTRTQLMPHQATPASHALTDCAEPVQRKELPAWTCAVGVMPELV